MDILTIDYLVIIIYVIITFFIALTVRKKQTAEGFLIGEKKLSFFSSSMTISASKVGAGLLLTYSALVFTYGFSALWLFAGYVFGYLIFYFFAVNLKKEADIHQFYTLSDYFRNKYGQSTAYFVSILALLSMFGWILTNLIGGGQIFSLLTGFPINTSIVIIGVIVIGYLYLGGFSAVVKTDVIQYISLIFIFLLLLFLIAKGNLFDFEGVSIEKIKIGQIAVFFLTGLLFPMGSAELWQRVYATKSVNDLRKSLITTSILYFVLGFILSLICLKILQTQSINTESDIALVKGISHLLPSGFAGVLVIAFFSAIMSSADTFLFTTSSVFSQDFFQKYYKVSNERIVPMLKKSVVVIGLIAIIIAVLIESIVDVTFLFTAMTISISVIAFFSWIVKASNSLLVNASIVISLIATTVGLIVFGIDLKLVVIALVSTIFPLLIGHIYTHIKKSSNG